MRNLIIIVTALCFALPLSAQLSLTTRQKESLASAIEDEIYDYGLEANFAYIGKALDGERQEVPLFVVKDSTTSSYRLIYRLMPYGELYRIAEVGPDGTVNLSRNPEMGFTPETSTTLTEYYDDDLICSLKQTALRLSFVVELHPSKTRVQEAIRNQQVRYGFSHLLRTERGELNSKKTTSK
jgi:hypothetical protein